MNGRRFEVTTFGETMLRLAAPPGHRLDEATRLDIEVGGAESNVAAALAAIGRRCGWLGHLPASPLGRNALRRIRAAGVDVSGATLVEGGRLGLYFVEFGAAPRPTEVHYDRAASVASSLGVDGLRWELLLDSEVLHLTGITPALGERPRQLVRAALARAAERGLRTSFDVNYRSKLWSPEQAAATLLPLLPQLDLLICGRGDAETVFGLGGAPDEVLVALEARCAGGAVVLTLGDEGALARDSAGAPVQVPSHPATVVDRVGAGDAFAAGVLDGWLDGDLLLGLRRGVALAALALSQWGDQLVTTRRELDELVAGLGTSLRR